MTSPERTISSMLHQPVLETKYKNQYNANMNNTSNTKFNSTGLKTGLRTSSSNPFRTLPSKDNLAIMANCYSSDCHMTGTGINDVHVVKPKSPRKRKSKRRRNKQYLKQQMADLPANIGDYENI